MEKENHPKQFKDMPTLQAPACSGVIPYLASNNVAGVPETVSARSGAWQGRHACCSGIPEVALHSFRKLAHNKRTWFK